MEETLLNLAKLSPVVAVLLFIVWQQGKRIDRSEQNGAAREQSMMAACEKRELALGNRLTEVENRQHNESAALLANNSETQKILADATKSFSRSLERWTDAAGTGSGKHPAR